MSNENRQPAGVPVGGQFATTQKGEPELALVGDTQPHRAAADQMVSTLASALGVDPSTVESRIDARRACGRAHGSADVTVTAALDDDVHSELELSFEVTQTGGIPEMGCTVQYDVEPIGGYDRDSVGSKLGYNQSVDEASIALLIADTRDQARMQRNAEATINRPQHEANLAPDSRRNYLDALRVEVVAGGACPAVETVNHRTGIGRHKVRLALEPGTGLITDGWLDTRYGNLRLQDENLDRVAGQVDRDLAFALNQWVEGYEVSRRQLEARLAAIVA